MSTGIVPPQVIDMLRKQRNEYTLMMQQMQNLFEAHAKEQEKMLNVTVLNVPLRPVRVGEQPVDPERNLLRGEGPARDEPPHWVTIPVSEGEQSSDLGFFHSRPTLLRSASAGRTLRSGEEPLPWVHGWRFKAAVAGVILVQCFALLLFTH